MKNKLKKIFTLSTAYYSIAIIAFCAVMLIAHSNKSSLSLDPSRMLYIYPFCLSFAIANVILKHTEIQSFFRWLLHFILTVMGAYLFIILPAKLEESSANFMGLMLIFAAYFVGVLLTLLFTKRIKNAMREDAEIRKNTKK